MSGRWNIPELKAPESPRSQCYRLIAFVLVTETGMLFDLPHGRDLVLQSFGSTPFLTRSNGRASNLVLRMFCFEAHELVYCKTTSNKLSARF